jgi:hypothetical protein
VIGFYLSFKAELVLSLKMERWLYLNDLAEKIEAAQ